MRHTIRAFVAVEVPEEIRIAARQLIAKLQECQCDVKWVEPHNLHFTLKFLGNIKDRDIPDVYRAIEAAIEGMRAFEMTVQGVGAFPNISRPRTLWLGIASGGEKLVDLYERLDARFAEIGFRQESRRFVPHLTLGRGRSGMANGSLVEQLSEFTETEFGPAPVDEVVLFSSELRPDGPQYEPLVRCEIPG